MTSTGRIANAALCATVGLLAAVAAALGVFARGDGTFVTVTSARGEVYEVATAGVYANSAQQLVAEGVGWDVVTLVVAAPALLVAAALVARGSFRASLVATGLLGYAAYLYLEYAVTWALGPLFPLFVGILALSVVALVGMARTIAAAGIARRFDDRFPRRSWAALSIGMASLLTVLWAQRIAIALSTPIPALEGETTLTVQALDLGLMVPAAVLVAVGALRRTAIGYVASAAFAVTFIAMSAAIAAMMISSWLVTGTPQLPPIVLFSLACAAGLAVAARMYTSAQPAMASALDHSVARPAPLPTAGAGVRH